MNVELINTGSELMLGRVLNTHQFWICHRLADLGYAVSRQVAVPDTARDIEQAVREAVDRSELVITTGGLGPTSDDITRDRIAAMFGKQLREDAEALKNIERIFAVRNRPMPASTKVQALVPEGAIVLANKNGTAPGLAMNVGKSKWLVMLPGPPRELRPMFNESVVPLLEKEFPLAEKYFCRTLRTTGIGESVLEEKIGAQLKPFIEHGLELGYCAHVGQVDVRLAGRGGDGSKLVREAEEIVRRLAGEFIFTDAEEHIEQVIVRLLSERRQTLALAESCTGGSIANRITNVSGASAVLVAGLVTYANDAKKKFIGVKSETLEAHGAVSEAVAREMAAGVRAETGADFSLSVTGIAGPTGGSDKKPVGTAFIGFSSARETLAVKVFNPYDRETFKQVTGQQALELLRRKILAA